MREIAETVLAEIFRLRQENTPVLIAIDGRCASGKTTLGERLREALSCDLFHMDDFFLRPEQRTPERYAQPGGNVDRERFFEEVLRPFRLKKPFSYRPFDCHSMTLKAPVPVTPGDIAVVEGTYSCHPALWEYYQLHVFLTTTGQKQMERIRRRNPAEAAMFETRWIPLEERYFSAVPVEARCELKFET